MLTVTHAFFISGPGGYKTTEGDRDHWYPESYDENQNNSSRYVINQFLQVVWKKLVFVLVFVGCEIIFVGAQFSWILWLSLTYILNTIFIHYPWNHILMNLWKIEIFPNKFIWYSTVYSYFKLMAYILFHLKAVEYFWSCILIYQYFMNIRLTIIVVCKNKTR